MPNAPLKVAFLGRLAPEKGLHILIHALRSVPELAVELDICLIERYDILAVPSLCLETGPLVVLEAFAAGVPVVRSDFGGIGERVRDGVDGLLVAPGSVANWEKALHRIASDRALLERIAAGVRPPRPITAVAEEMLTLYTDALASNRKAEP